MTLGQKIKEARLERGMTQKELVGDHITRNMLSKIENGSATPSVRTLEYLSGRLGLSAAYFMTDLMLSDGTSPDGLDEMRLAYREGRYDDCISLLENSQTAGTTDEGYLLRSLADLAAAREAIAAMDFEKAKNHADSADYYNKQGLYYSAEIDAEMSLILAECSNHLDVSEFMENANEFLRAVNAISFTGRFELAMAEYAFKTGNVASARELLNEVQDSDEIMPKKYFIEGSINLAEKNWSAARDCFLSAKMLGLASAPLYSALETCYKELEDYKMAYYYATLQK